MTRLLLSICVCLSVIIPSFAQSDWMTNVEEALLLATKNKKSVYLHFTGSDWCSPCQKLTKEVLSSKEFLTLAKKEFILVSLDFPKESSLSPKQLEYNKSIAKKYSIVAHPSSLLLDHQGNVYWKKIGNASKGEFISELKQALQVKNTIVHNLYNASRTEGLQKAKLLKEAYNAMSPDMQLDHATIIEEVIQLDPEDSLGVKANKKENDLDAKQEVLLRQFIDENVLPLIKKKENEQALNALKEYMDSTPISTINRQRVYQIMARLNLDMEKKNQAIALLNEAINISPDTSEAKKAKNSLKNLTN